LICIWYPERALKIDREFRVFFGLWEPKNEAILLKRRHCFSPSPITIPNFSNNAQYGIVRHDFDCPDQLGEQLRSGQDRGS
jgi:hypothetical protein